jgi:hypothetical protein
LNIYTLKFVYASFSPPDEFYHGSDSEILHDPVFFENHTLEPFQFQMVPFEIGTTSSITLPDRIFNFSQILLALWIGFWNLPNFMDWSRHFKSHGRLRVDQTLYSQSPRWILLEIFPVTFLIMCIKHWNFLIEPLQSSFWFSFLFSDQNNLATLIVIEKQFEISALCLATEIFCTNWSPEVV